MDDGPVALEQSREMLKSMPHKKDEEENQLRQYQSILAFHDVILSGKHPIIKLPPGFPLLPVASHLRSTVGPTHGDTSTAPNAQDTSSSNVLSNNLQPVGASQNLSTPKFRPSAPIEINPILLEKSDELIRAEIQLHRQRLERALRDDVEQRRTARSEKTELLTDIDLSDVLSKALTLVKGTSGPILADSNVSATNEPSSDSFDDNTFYSSRHDTPESHLASRIPNESDDAAEYEPFEAQPATQPEPVTQQIAPASPFGHAASSGINQKGLPTQSGADAVRTQPGVTVLHPSTVVRVPGLNNYPEPSRGLATAINPTGSYVISEAQSALHEVDQSGQKDARPPQRDARMLIDDVYIDAHPPSPLVRSHAGPTQVMAPQPLRHSPLVGDEAAMRNADLPPTFAAASNNHSALAPAPSSNIVPASRAPAQVAALRNDTVATGTSPDSSPQTGKGSEKRKAKKKKRKMDRQAPEDVMPYIKPEPRSPSPLGNTPAIRPPKRQKQAPRHPAEAETEGYRPSGSTQPSAMPFDTRPFRDGVFPSEHGGAVAYPHRSMTVSGVAEPGYASGLLDDRRRLADPYVVGQASSPQFLPPRVPSVVYSSRPIMVHDGYQDQQRIYREHPEAARVSIRPETEAYGQPRPPSRLLVDSFGREYIEPPRPIIRQSVAPPVHRGDVEVLYERAMPRATPRLAAHSGYDDGHIVYPRAASAYPMPRRIVTQPEYVHPPEYVEARTREYSTRPLGPPAEYLPMPPPPSRPAAEGDALREYPTRAVSVRPGESIRYEVPHDYGRMQSARPDGFGRDYVEAAPTDRTRYIAEPYTVEYGSRPAEGQIAQAGFGARPVERPVERYYEQPQQLQQQRPEAVAYVERPPPPVHDFGYADNVRREGYQ